jgi:ketosteroid isomerase-like protein
MRRNTYLAGTTVLLAVTMTLGGCGSPSMPASEEPTEPAGALAAGPSAARATASPQERAVHEAMENLKQYIVERNVPALSELWTEDYTFINPQGGLVTREQRIANLTSGNTNVQIIDNEREITIRVYGDMAVVQNLSTLRGTFSGAPTDTDLRGTFVWVRRNGQWRLVTNQLTPVVPTSS